MVMFLRSCSSDGLFNTTAGREVEIFVVRRCRGRIPGTNGLQYLTTGDRLKIAPEDARQLVVWARAAYYVNERDDSTSDKRFTIGEKAQSFATKAEIRLD